MVLAGITRYLGGGEIIAFLCSALAVTLLAPLLVILSQLFGLAPLTRVFTPMLVASVAIVVYAIIATAFWWR